MIKFSELNVCTKRVQLVGKVTSAKFNFRIRNAEDVDQLVGPEMRLQDREHLLVLYLDQNDELIDIEHVYIGTQDKMIVEPREVFKGAILAGADQIILVHNHPGGKEYPSYEDVEITRKLIAAGNTLGIFVRDHVIIGRYYFSLRENGWKNMPALWERKRF